MEAAQLPWIPLGTLLVRGGLLTPQQLEDALAVKRQTGQRVGEIVVEKGWVKPSALAHALAEQYNLPFLDLGDQEVDAAVGELLPEKLARRYGALPIRYLDDGSLLVAVSDPTNVVASDDLRLALGTNLEFTVVSQGDLDLVLNRIFRDEIEISVAERPPVEEELDLEADLTDEGQGPIVNLVNAVLRRAIEDGASDIHFEPQAKQMLVRARVDGVMRPVISIPRHMQAGVVSRLKVMSALDIAERRLPQDGRVSVRVAATPMDLRIAVVPTTHGEQVVMRIFQRGVRRFDLAELGLRPEVRAKFEHAVRQPYGAVIVCGPTGSGKTTTLYAAVDLLNDQERVIQTIEDPVEYQIEGINQVEINPKAGLTFARGLRALLRSDPDVLMVGEIRDEETARIAANAAMTGHLVLSSLHARDAASAIERLRSMGVDRGLLASAFNCIVGQRLVRRLCRACREPYAASPEEMEELGLKGRTAVTLHRPRGCLECAHSGYSGRVALCEVMPVTTKLRRLLDATTEEIFAAAVVEGMTTMRDDGLRLCLDGISSVDEIRRVTCDRPA